jgi:aminomethyltransferase
MKSTPFTDIHIGLGAKMLEFAGYNMPVSYSGINDEHLTVRSAVGVFDVSHMGEFILKGNGAKDLVQRITTNDVNALTPGKVQYSCLTNPQGGIVDDLLVYMLEDGNWMLVVNASNIEKDWNWLMKNNTGNVEAHNVSDHTALLAVQGPKAAEALQPLADFDLASLKYYTFRKGVFAGVKNVLVSATGYTGAGGFEIYFDNRDNVNGQPVAHHIWNAIFESGRPFGIKPVGLGARDTLRLEMGFCLYGNDIDDTTSPIEAGLGWITKLVDGNHFTARDQVEALRTAGPTRKLVGFELREKAIPRHGYAIMSQGSPVGVVTSGTQSPSLQKGIGMGYVPSNLALPGTLIDIDIRGKAVPATVVKLPFYRPS